MKRHIGNRRRHRSSQRGFTLLEILAGLAIASLVLVGVALMINRSLDDARGQQTALYQLQLAGAAAQLVSQDAAALTAAATSTKPVVIPLTGSPYQLSSFLPSGVQNQNAYGQVPCLLVYASGTGGLLALLVTEGGTSIGDEQLGYIVANAGQGAGSIPMTGNPTASALGAFGGWRVNAPNPASASCSGTPTGVGHMVSEVGSGQQAQNNDYLYRVAVPGDAAANTMQVPIVLAQQTDYAACTQGTGAVAADAGSGLLTCRAGIWQPVASMHWRDPVAAAADLSDPTKMPSPQLGDVAMTTNTGRAYTFNGTAWQALAVDELGDIALGNQGVANTPCAANQTDTTPVTTDASGRVLSCQNGTWQPQFQMTAIHSDIDCVANVTESNASDFPCGTATPAAQYNGSTGYMYSSVTRTLPATSRNGLVNVYAWAHMTDGYATSCPNAQTDLGGGGGGYEVLYVQIIDNDTGQTINSAVNQSSRIVGDLVNINVDISQLLPANSNGYSVMLTTSWILYSGDRIATYDGPFETSYCGGSALIYTKPVVTSWNITESG